MKVKKFSEYLQKLETTTKRLEIVEILQELLKELSQDELRQAVYLSLGMLDAKFRAIRFNMADKMAIRSMVTAFEASENKINTLYADLGDLGSVSEVLSSQAGKELDIVTFYDRLLRIANFEGSGSQDRKTAELAQLLLDLEPLSSKFAVRIVLGTTRLGFTELTVLDALNRMFDGDKETKKEIELKYNSYPDIGLITEKLMNSGMTGLKEIHIETGVPLSPQKAQRVAGPEEAVEKIGEVWVENKFDGTRVQLHLDRNKKTIQENQAALFEISDSSNGKNAYLVKTFTRNLDETTHQFPEIIKAAKDQINAESIILDGEAIGYNRDTGEYLVFQDTIQRKRKHGVSEIAKEIPLKYLVFDILLLNGESLLEKPLEERRALLESVIEPGETIEVVDYKKLSSVEEIEESFKDAKRHKLEGIMGKNPNSEYSAGARAYSWVKIKRLEDEFDKAKLNDTVDCVVLGYYFGKGSRAKYGIGGFLVGVFDEETESYKSVSKIGTGLTEEDWGKMKDLIDEIKTKEIPENVQVPKSLVPDVLCKPKIVVEVRSDEITKSSQHTAGYALRFPRLMNFRTDKSPTDATTIKEIEDLYMLQTE